MEMSGVEPLTFWLQTRCSPNWATPPCGMFLSIPQSRYECQIYLQNLPGRSCTSPSAFRTDAPIWATGTQAILSILQKPENVKFIFWKLPKNVNFLELPFTGDIKYTPNPWKCQIYFPTVYRIPQKTSLLSRNYLLNGQKSNPLGRENPSCLIPRLNSCPCWG